MGWVAVKSDIKVPIWKNIVYAFKILYSCSKSYMVWHLIDLLSYTLFHSFFRGILFLKVLLGIIEKNMDFTFYIKNLALFLLCGLCYEFISVYSDYKTLVGEKKMFKALNNKIFKKAAEVDISCYEDPVFYDKYQRASEILTGGYFSAYAYAVSSVISNFIAFISVISIVASIHFTYLLFLLPIAFVFLIEVAKSKVVYKRDFSMTTNNRIKAYTQRIVFLRDYAKDIRTSNIFSVIIGRFNKAVQSNIEILKSYGVKLFLFSMISSLFGEFIPIIGTYAFAGYQFIYTSALSVSGFSVVLSSIYSVRSTTEMMANEFAELSAVALYFQNLCEFFEYESKVVSGEKEPGEFESLEFKNVYFKYPSAEKYSLQNVNLKIEKGQTVAVVGVNGAGKTTLTNLLLRLYDVTDGEILIGGRNIKDETVASHRNRFSAVFQDFQIFAASLGENVALNINPDRKEVQTALEHAGFTKKTENGIDTELLREFDDNGTMLSGGEAQKVAVSRAFYKSCPYVIMDEPSANLDPVAEYNLNKAMMEAAENKTVIFISHRLSTTRNADKIYVMENGTIIESGTHSELMNKNGKYAYMFNLQAEKYQKA